MTNAVDTEQSWFRTITRPASRMIFTVLALVAFFAGIALGVALPENQLWFQVPAVLILMVWFLVMTHHHRRARAPRA
jgi:positive regulator of sigma E activity